MHATTTATYTFLFTDIEGSTRAWAEQPEAMPGIIERHDRLMDGVVGRHGGSVFKRVGDAVCAVFGSTAAALGAAVDAQRELAAQDWSPLAGLRVRMALHSGEAQERDADYFGTTVNRAARLLAAGNGGQVLVSDAFEALVADQLPPGLALKPLGEHRLKDLARPVRILQVVAEGLGETFPALRTLDNRPNNLPIQLTSFIGREQDLTGLADELARARLVTLVGVGGTGKTRLALQLAADRLFDYPEGVWLVELAALDSAELVPQALFETLGLAEQPGRAIEHTIAEFLKGKRMLLLLDNCEHVVDGVARLVKQLLGSARTVAFLATSREALGVPGELVRPVTPMSVPPSELTDATDAERDFEGLRLFVERAQAHRAGFALTDDNLAAVAGICRRLDGLPLAIELAAARVRSLAPEQILGRLDHQFALLTGQERQATLPHHQTLRAAIDWSFDLLAEAEQAMFRRLAVFRGGWAIEAAEAVVADDPEAPWEVLDTLSGLVDKSLVVLSEEGGAARYRMLETIAAYAGEKLRTLPDRETSVRRHADWCLDLAEHAAAGLQGPEQHAWGRRLGIEHDNLRAALRRSINELRDAELATRLAAALGPWWLTRGHLNEGREMLGAALVLTGADPKVRASALELAGTMAYRQGDYEAASTLTDRGLAIHREQGDRVGVARALRTLGNIADERGQPAEAIALHSEALGIWRSLDDAWGIAAALNNLGLAERRAHDLPAARVHLEESLLRFQAQDNAWAVAVTHANLGDLAIDMGDPEAARNHYHASLERARSLEDPEGVSYALVGLADAARLRQDPERAWHHLREALTVLRDLGVPYLAADWLEAAALAAMEERRMHAAVRLLAAAEALRAKIGAPVPANRQIVIDQAREQSRVALRAEAFAAASREGQILPWLQTALAVLAGVV